jgi:GNAT superfamily N-acetyltransferase
MNPFAISPAAESDVFPILEMIRELAEFEGLRSELEVTADSLREALFGARPAAAALLARVADQPVGYAVCFQTFSTFTGRPGIFLDDLYVRPTFRGRGIGRALLLESAKLGAAAGGRMEWITLRWNENAFRFYSSLGAKVMEDWALLRMNGQQVRNLVNATVEATA